MPRMHDATRQAHRSPSSRDPAPSGDPHKQRQKQLPHGCHPPRKITHKSALCCFALVVLATGCTAAPADTLILSPLGRHEVPVGSTWLLELQTKGAIGAVAFELRRGPAAMRVVELAGRPMLSWQPNVFDLAQSPAGSERAPGAEHNVEVGAQDASGDRASARGVVRAVPAQ
jgi:hypothetical protein